MARRDFDSINIRQEVWEGIGGLKEPNDTTVAQLKYDGSQYHLHIANGKAYALTSKRISKKTGLLSEKLANFPALKEKKFSFMKETILVTEVIAEHLASKIDWKNRCSYVAGIMNSNPDHVPDPNPLALIVHDILMWEGKNVTQWSYRKKYLYLWHFFDKAGRWGENVRYGGIYLVQNVRVLTQKEFDGVFEEAIKKGFEGLILKDMENNTSLKRKRELTADCFIIGFTEGQGKYRGQIGAIELGVFAVTPTPHQIKATKTGGIKDISYLLDRGILVKVGQCSGMDDGMRSDISKHEEHYLGKVMEVEYMQWTGKALRHPRFLRMRDDKLIHRVDMTQFGE